VVDSPYAIISVGDGSLTIPSTALQLFRRMPVNSNGEHFIFTRERVLTFLLAGATLIGLYVCYLIAKPFIAPIAFALALAVATQQPFNWLRRRMRSDTAAAAVAVVLVTLLIVGPAIGLATLLIQQAADNVQELQSGESLTNWRAAIERQPQLARLYHWAESRLDVQGQLQRIGQAAAGYAGTFLKGSMHVLTQLVIMLFVLFFMYRDRKQAHDALCQLVPLSGDESDRLFNRVTSTILATVNGSITVAIVQSVLAGLMYWFLGVPAPALWAAATFICALVPVFGTFLVWGPIALYLAFTGSVVKAIILVAWGMIAIGTIDNILYPYLVGDRLRLHTVPTFFSILGGLTLFGPAGLILGPLALAITIALIDVWWERTTEGRAAEEAIAEDETADKHPPGAELTNVGAK
jgi:predicted PurR-regulated permease PerM